MLEMFLTGPCASDGASWMDEGMRGVRGKAGTCMNYTNGREGEKESWDAKGMLRNN